MFNNTKKNVNNYIQFLHLAVLMLLQVPVYCSLLTT